MRLPLGDLNGMSFDVAIIGGGINGASAAQELAAIGHSVLLAERGDFASGSTSRSSRLLHCGLRYFETPNPLLDFATAPSRLATAIRMARQCMTFRQELIETSETRTKPINLCFPISRHGPYRPWQFDLVFRLLQSFAPDGPPLEYRRLSVKDTAALPMVSQIGGLADHEAVAVFREYIMHWPERICMDTIIDAQRLGATARNYTEARILQKSAAGRWQIALADRLAEQEEAIIEAGVVFNMAGIWIDQVTRQPAQKARRRILGTKGVSMAVRLPFDCGNYAIASLTKLGEPFYCFPWHGLHYFGPTETVYEGDPDNVTADGEDIRFLLDEANALFPQLRLGEADIVYTWAGVRPLTFDENVPKGKRSREFHDLSGDGLPGVFALTAGPVMSYRSAGRQCCEIVGRRISPKSASREPDYRPREFPEDPNSPQFLDDVEGLRMSHLIHAAGHENAERLVDILFRRTPAAWIRPLSVPETRKAATAVAATLGWDRARIEREVESFHEEWQRFHQPPPAEI